MMNCKSVLWHHCWPSINWFIVLAHCYQLRPFCEGLRHWLPILIDSIIGRDYYSASIAIIGSIMRCYIILLLLAICSAMQMSVTAGVVTSVSPRGSIHEVFLPDYDTVYCGRSWCRRNDLWNTRSPDYSHGHQAESEIKINRPRYRLHRRGREGVFSVFGSHVVFGLPFM